MPNIKLDVTQRKLIGSALFRMKEAGLAQKGDGPGGWWADVERDYRNEAPPDMGKGIVGFHVPFTQPRIDALTAQVCTVICKQEPYMLAANVGDSDKQDRLQRFVHTLWQDAGIEIQMRKASTIAACTNSAFYRLTPRKPEEKVDGATGQQLAGNVNGRAGVQIDVMHGSDVVVFPAGLGGIEKSTLVAHRLYPQVQAVQAAIDNGTYYKTTVHGGAAPDEYDDTGAFAHAGSCLADWGDDQRHSQTEVWTGNARLNLADYDPKLPKGEKWYIVTFSHETQELLLCMELPYSRPWYFQCYYIADERLFWSGRSVGRNLHGLQSAYDNTHSMLYTATARAAGPVVIGPKLDEKYTEWGFGDYLGTDNPVNPWSPQVRVDTGGLILQLQIFDRAGDRVARISENTTGGQTSSHTTATEQSIIAAGVAVGLEEYIANVSAPLGPMAALTCEIAEKDFETIGMAFWEEVEHTDPQSGEKVFIAQPIIEEDDLKAPVIWETNGKSPAHTPQMKQQGAQLLANMSANPAFGYDPYHIGQVILKTGPLSATDGIQIPEEEFKKMMQAQAEAAQAAQEAELAAKQKPPVHISDIVDANLYELLTPIEKASYLQQIGITPDPAHLSGQLAPGEKGPHGQDDSAKTASDVVDGAGGQGAQITPDQQALRRIDQMFESRRNNAPGGPDQGAGPPAAA